MDNPIVTAYKTPDYRVFLVRRFRVSPVLKSYAMTFAICLLLRIAFYYFGLIPSLK